MFNHPTAPNHPRPTQPTTGLFSIGDSIYTGGKAIKFPGIPSFSPEVFAYIINPNTGTWDATAWGRGRLCFIVFRF